MSKLNLIEELDIWLDNRQSLINDLQQAYRLKDRLSIDDICLRITTVDRMIGQCCMELKKQGYSYTKITSTVSIQPNVDISQDSSFKPAVIELIRTDNIVPDSD